MSEEKALKQCEKCELMTEHLFFVGNIYVCEWCYDDYMRDDNIE
jgi:hypothetical protein